MTIAISIPNGSIGFDHSDSRLTYNQAQSYAAKGYKFCIRYIPNPLSLGETDLIKDEADAILAAGLWLGAVQHCCKATETSDFVPFPAQGREWGALAALHASEAGLATGTTVWLDLEGIKEGTPVQDILGFCNEWFAQVTEAGFDSGVYVGFDSGLTAEQLYFQLTTKHYWRAPSAAPDVAYRGYQILQHLIKDVKGNEIDVNQAQVDRLGLSATVTSLLPSQ
ncbi:glycoside hydrolase domain-containing protein [Cupriavidus malaysiensis]|uniref:glycoside hydrolase domain-containing protein n=1 Tax=Cupriavidus malaysiensis TaxID=367825 RepID=UPI0009FE3F03|nr:glycoside hydrolase domain-containing protein [Cupriavidus malaysiensis]